MTPEELKELQELEELEALEKRFANQQPQGKPYTPKKQYRFDSFMMEGEEVPIPEKLEKAAASGVNIDNRLPSDISATAGFAANPAEKQAYIEAALKGRYGDSLITRMGPDSEQIEFWNPEDERWMLAEPNVAEMSGTGFETVMSTLGALGGTAAGGLSGNPVVAGAGGIGGGAIGQAVGTFAKIKMGQLFGINEGLNASIDNASAAGMAAEEGATAGAIDTAFTLGYGGMRGLKAWIWGKQYLNPSQAQDLLYSQRRAEQLIDEVNGTVGDDSFKPWTAQAAAGTEVGDKVLADAVNVMTDPQVGLKLGQQFQTSEKALARYFDANNVNQRVDMYLDNPAQGAEQLKQSVRGEMTDVGQRVAALPQGNGAEAGRSVRGAMQGRMSQATAMKDQAYAKYQDLAGYSGETGRSNLNVPITDEIRRHQQNLKIAIDSSPTKRAAAAKKPAVLKNVNKDTPEVDLDEWLATGKIPKGKESINLADLDDTLRFLRDELRQSKAGKLGIPMNRRDTKQLVEVLTKARNDFLSEQNPEALDALLTAEKAAYDQANLFKHGLAKTLLVKQGANYKLSDAKVISSIVKNRDPAAAAEIASIIKGDPRAMLETQNYLFALYRRSVAKDADKTLVTYKSHKAFMDKYGEVLDQFFTPEQSGKLREIGKFAEVLAKNTDNMKALDAAWNRSYKGKVDSMSAEALTDGIFTKRLTNEDVAGIKKLAQSYAPEVLDNWKSGIAMKLRERIFTEGKLDNAKFSHLMKDYDSVAKLHQLFGGEYVRNLETLKQAMDLMHRTPPRVNLPNKETLWTDLARATYAPPMGHAGRVVTLGQNLRARNLANQIYMALTDPEELGRWASRTRRTMQTLGLINSAGAATYSAMGEEENVK